MGASRLMSENGSLFSRADLQIQLHAPAAPTEHRNGADALRETSPAYRAKSPGKKPRAKKQ
jgi:hypothetical protein